MAIIVAVTGGAALGLLGGPVWILVLWAAVASWSARCLASGVRR
jgi:hypothetical protein